jgi:hypothetical protein
MCRVKGKPTFVFHEAYPQGKTSLQKAIFFSDWMTASIIHLHAYMVMLCV